MQKHGCISHFPMLHPWLNGDEDLNLYMLHPLSVVNKLHPWLNGDEDLNTKSMVEKSQRVAVTSLVKRG